MLQPERKLTSWNHQKYMIMINFEKIKNGDVQEFEKMFELHYKQLVEFACYYFPDQSSAENVVQDVFVSVWKNRKKINLKKTIKAYLYSATKKTALRYLRDKNNHRKFFLRLSSEHDVQVLPHDAAIIDELEAEIEKAISNLPEKGRIIFCMNRFDHLSYSEIAEILNISIKTVETHMARNLKYLRKCLANF
jgi:RNA polymerase sigma-70 factor (ECF subfamily)